MRYSMLYTSNQRATADDVWQRARRQVEPTSPGRQKATYNYLPESQMPDFRAFDSAPGQPDGLSRPPIGKLADESGAVEISPWQFNGWRPTTRAAAG